MSFLKGMFKVPETFKSLEVKAEDDDENTFNRWANKDCIPVPKAMRMYTTWAFMGYWYVNLKLESRRK
jgi:hypothetical protein